jgi:CheY-like chemotaxis protein
MQKVAPDLAAKMMFMTGGALSPRALAFLDQHANRSIDKPFKPAILRQAVQELLA